MSDAIVIIGAGQAGGRVAEELRAAGATAPIHLVGAERHPPYERPPLSKDLLTGKIAVEQTYIQPAGYWAEHGVTLHLGTEATAIDRGARTVRLSDGTTLPYATLVLATGGRPRRLSLPGADSPRVRYVRDIADTAALTAAIREGTRLAVVGAGVIGLEVAASARALGAAVTVVEVGPAPLGRVVERAVGDWFADLHARHGVTLCLGASLQALEPRPDGIALALSGGATIEADLVVAGIGLIPSTELAREAGLEVEDGIVVDQTGRTSDPAIYAVGDVARAWHPLLGRHVRQESWRNAENQSRATARGIAGGDGTYAEVPWMWSDQYDVNLQVAGLPRAVERSIWRGTAESGKFTIVQLQDGVVVGGVTVNQGRDQRPIQQLIAKAAKPDPARLADPAVPLAQIAKGA